MASPDQLHERPVHYWPLGVHTSCGALVNGRQLTTRVHTRVTCSLCREQLAEHVEYLLRLAELADAQQAIQRTITAAAARARRLLLGLDDD